MSVPSEAEHQLRVLNEFSADLLDARTVEQVVWSVAKQAIGRLGFEDCVVYLARADERMLEQVASHGPKNPRPGLVLNPIRIPFGSGVVGAAAESQALQNVPDTESDARYIVDDESRLSELAVPMIYDGRCIGVVDSEHSRKAFYTDSHESIMSTIASLAAARIVHMRDLDEIVVSRNLFAQLVENASDIIFRSDVRGRFTYVNPVAMRETGYSESELLSMSFVDLVIEGDKGRVSAFYRDQYRHQREATYLEFRILTRDGHVKWMGQSLQLISGDTNGPGFQAIARNISVLKQAQFAVAQSEEEKASILTNALDAIISIKADSEVVAFNPAAEAMFGISQADALGCDLAELIIPDRYVTGHRQALKRLQAGGASTLIGRRVEMEAKHAQGHEFPVELALTSIQASDGIRYTAFVRDISVERAAKTATEEARRLAEESSTSKANFLAAMSHEIRTPLNAVIGITHLLGQTELDPKQQTYLRDIRRSSNGLMGLINNVLDFQKIDAGSLSLERIPFDVRELVEEVAGRARYDARPKGLEVLVETFPDAPCWVLGDPLRVNQIVSNLVSNAVKFTDDGHVRLHVRVENEEEISITVSDTGIGIPSERLAHVFEPFAQAESETARRYGGTGLGLPIVQHLVSMMNGQVDVQSVEGEGSEFRIRIPLPQTPPSPRASFSDSLSLKLPPVKILVVEDNEVNQLVAREILSSWGADVTLASGGREALSLLAQQSFSLVLMDIQMPDMDGYETTRALRNQLGLTSSDLPVIALTAFALQEQRNMALECGMNDFVMKPFDPQHLHASIMQALESRFDTGNSDGPLLDWSFFEENYGDNETLRIRVVQIMSDQLPPSRDALLESAQTGDWEAVQFIVHKLIPTVQMLGAVAITELCRKVQFSIESGMDDARIRQDVVQLAGHLESVQRELALYSTS